MSFAARGGEECEERTTGGGACLRCVEAKELREGGATVAPPWPLKERPQYVSHSPVRFPYWTEA